MTTHASHNPTWMAIFRDFAQNARMSGAPVTVALVIAQSASFLAAFFTQRPLLQSLMFMTAGGRVMGGPWTFASYPFFIPGNGQDLFWFVLTMLWLWGFGCAVERDLGPLKFALVWVSLTILGALGLWAGSAILQGNAWSLYGGIVPISAITVIWGVRNPDSPVMLMLVLPITGRWLAWFTAGISVVYVASMNQNAQAGLFSALPLIAAYLYASNRLPFVAYGSGPVMARKPGGKAPVWMTDEYVDNVKKREKEREEKERLRRLFENSLRDEDEPKA